MTQLWSTQGTMPASLEPMRTTPWGLMIGRACVIVGIQETAMCADNEALKRDQDKGTRQMPQRSSKWEFNKLGATLSNPEHMLRYCAFEAATNRVPQLNRCHLKFTRDSRESQTWACQCSRDCHTKTGLQSATPRMCSRCASSEPPPT